MCAMNPEMLGRQYHVSYDLVKLTTGKMSGRRGRYLLADDLYAELKGVIVEKMRTRFQEKVTSRRYMLNIDGACWWTTSTPGSRAVRPTPFRRAVGRPPHRACPTSVFTLRRPPKIASPLYPARESLYWCLRFGATLQAQEKGISPAGEGRDCFWRAPKGEDRGWVRLTLVTPSNPLTVIFSSNPQALIKPFNPSALDPLYCGAQGEELEPELFERITHEVAAGAMKYALLSCGCHVQINFDIAKVRTPSLCTHPPPSHPHSLALSLSLSLSRSHSLSL
eukprot:1195248-Prorocentrum_minimum.AAC.1